MYDFHDHFWANLVMHIYSMLQVCIIAIWSWGLKLNSRRSYATFGTKIRYLFLELIQGAFWVQNGKNDGFTKLSV